MWHNVSVTPDAAPLIPTILHVAVPGPLRRLFDYLPHVGHDPLTPLQPGIRLRLPFGRSERIGILLGVDNYSALEPQRLKPALALLENQPLLSPPLLQLLQWASRYYHHPIGEVCSTALPKRLRQGNAAIINTPRCWTLSAAGAALSPDRLSRLQRQAPLQWQIFQQLQQSPTGLTPDRLKLYHPAPAATLKRLQTQGWIELAQRAPPPAAVTWNTTEPTLHANSEQQHAIATLIAGLGKFHTYLLDGITGSGKTEVYLQAVAAVLQRGGQTLLLVPEIGLTPQLVERFSQRFNTTIGLLHSALNDQERSDVWLRASRGEIAILIGTRSAIFTPLPRLGLIILDEEHDASFKQQDHFRYHARDVAIKRAQMESVPIILGSASPSLESLHNAWQQRYTHLLLRQRAGGAVPPRIHTIDLRQQRLQEGLSATLLGAIGDHLERGGQVLIFLNRRGYAPLLLCHHCGWSFQCRHCDARLTLYHGQRDLRCHHCGSSQPRPEQCPECHSSELRPIGNGTERIELALNSAFPEVPVLRIDRDATRRKGALAEILAEIQQGQRQILIGTQMIAKGHHFPAVTLVGIINGDQGLYSVDFRAGERMAQQLIQVAGRAGRAERAGEVVIQTHAPDHPLLAPLLAHDYHRFARDALRERQAVGLPPFRHLALIRADATQASGAQTFLQEALGVLQPAADVEIFGPLAAPMERRAGQHHYQLLLQARQRQPLHQLLEQKLDAIAQLKSARQVRWSLDIDPIEIS
ncbi:MAG: primosomal protein N' [Gammaproteobacteria bacterium]|nr:primosomal protein N' [Gammaproteobacteria bacterium]